MRREFIEAAKELEPLDAAVLPNVQERLKGQVDGNARNTLAGLLNASRDEVDVSVQHLIKIGLLAPTNPPNTILDFFGREFLRAVEE